MQMENRLPRVWANVVNRSKSMFQVALVCDLGRDKLAITNQFRVSFARLINAGNMLFRDDQHMRRRLWIDVFKSKCFFIFVNFFSGNFSGDDIAEETVGHRKEC